MRGVPINPHYSVIKNLLGPADTPPPDTHTEEHAEGIHFLIISMAQLLCRQAGEGGAE